MIVFNIVDKLSKEVPNFDQTLMLMKICRQVTEFYFEDE